MDKNKSANMKRIEIAEALAAAVAADKFAAWTAEVWSKNDHVRVYARRRGAEQGYYEIDGDGDIITGSATNRDGGMIARTNEVAAAHGVNVYTKGA